MIKHERGRIILTDDTARSFARKMKEPNAEVMKKRDAYFKKIENTLNVSHDSEGNVILRCR